MILIDTSVWVDHLRRGDVELAALLDDNSVLIHPFVIGELACDSLADRHTVLDLLKDLPAARIAEPDEVLTFIDAHRLHGKGIGYVDVHLLAAAALTEGATLWTRDKRLHAAAVGLGCAYLPAGAH